MSIVKKKAIAKSAAMERTLDGALNALLSVSDKGNQAVLQRSREVKRMTALNKKLVKKRTTLNKKKKSATIKLMKDPSRENKKNLTSVAKELKMITGEIDKLKKAKATSAAELSALKSCVKRANAYLKCIERTDKAMQKPVRSRKPRIKVA